MVVIRFSVLVLFFLSACSTAPSSSPGTSSPLADVVIADTQVFPESMTSMDDGTLFIGSVKGNVYRAEPGEAEALPWIKTSSENGILTILGVLADETSNTLWLCSVPNFFGPERSQGVSALMAFDLQSGAQKGVYPFPSPASVCNDVTIAKDGSAYAADTSNGRIFILDKGADALRLFGSDPLLVGIDGLAFSEDWTLYINNVQTNAIIRVGMNSNNLMGELTPLNLSHTLGGPDGFRLIEGNRFIQAEGTIGRLSIVTIEGNDASLEILRNDLISSPGATTVGSTAYVIESNIQYLTDPSLQGQEPGAFMLYAVPLK